MTRKILFIFVLFPFIYNANYPIEIIRPRESVGANDRIQKAYPGITYTINTAVYGGTYPFTYSLSGEPAGMTIDSDTGVITWLNPTVDSGTVTVTVTDADSSSTSASWDVSCTTTKFYFVDKAFGAGGDGSSTASPFDDWDDFYLGISDSTYQNAIIYFMDGTYPYPLDHTSGTHGDSNRLWIRDNHPKSYLAYPGENAVYFDGEKSTNKINLYTDTDNLYFDNIEFINGCGFGIETAEVDYLCAINCTFRDFAGNASVSNQAGILFYQFAPLGSSPPVSDSGFSLYPVIQDCTFEDMVDTSSGVRAYGIRYGVIDDNVMDNITHPSLGGYGISIKSTCDKVMIRDNLISNTSDAGIVILGGNYTDNCDISFNFINNSGGYSAILVGTGDSVDDGPGPTYIYRNTIVGNFWFRYVDSADGPINILNNVIINSAPADHIRDEIGEHYTITANKSILTDNLLGGAADNIVDGDGKLLGTYRTLYLGDRGYELGDASPPEPPEPQSKHTGFSTSGGVVIR